MTASPVSTPSIGYRVGDRYELMGPIATGGMAQVWRGHDTVLNRPVAVKVLHPHLATDHGFLTRFRREAVAAARLSHPSIVAIYDTVSTPATVAGGPTVEAIVMELIEGQTLRTVLDANPQLSPADVIHLGLQVSEALDEAHGGGVVHRDIKPSNILMCGDKRVMVTDFGIAKAGEDTDLTVTGTLLGTAKYLAPEQVRGEDVDPRSDLYALGVVLYEALAGQPPFRAETDAATALARLHNDPAPIISHRPDTPPGLATVVMKLLARDPDDRFARAREVRAALSGIVRPSTNPAYPTVAALDQTTPQLVPTSNGQPRSSAHAAGAPPIHPRAGLSGTDAPPPAETDDGFVQSERSWLVPAMVVILLAGALVLAAALFTKSPLASSAGGGGPSEPTLSTAEGDRTGVTPLANVIELVEPQVVAAMSLDPEGDDKVENEDLTWAAFDDDDDTTWRTVTYRSPNFGRLKSGVGLVLDMGGRAEVTEIEFQTPSIAWDLLIFVGDDFSGAPTEWGDPVAQVSYDGDDDYNVDIPPSQGTKVLLWIIDPGLSPDRDDLPGDDFRFELAEVTLS